MSQKWIKYGDKVDGIKQLNLSFCVQKIHQVLSVTYFRFFLVKFVNEYWFSFLFSGQGPKGKPSPVKSSDIEGKFQSNPTSSYTFTVGAETLEIKFGGEV